MKRIFRKRYDDGHEEEAVVVQDDSAVTVTRRDIGSRSLGHPKRIPVKLCAGKSIAQEARAQALLLQGDGFEFTKEEDQETTSEDGFLYLVIEGDNAEEAIRLVSGCGLEALTVQQTVTGATITDESSQMVVIRKGQKTTAVIKAVSTLAAMAIVLEASRLARVVVEQQGGPAKAEPLTPLTRNRVVAKMPPSAKAFLESEGLLTFGVLKSRTIKPAFLF